MSFDEIKVQSDIDVENLKKMLHSLSCNKFNLLLKTGERTKIGPSDSFKVNEEFSSKLLRFTIPVPTEKDTFSREKIEIDWSGAIEANIVKILKAWRKISHVELVQEVLNLLSTF